MKRLSLLFFIGLSTVSLHAMSSDATQHESQAYNKTTSTSFLPSIKKAATLVAALGAALAAHIITELPIIIAHEYGHHFGNYLSGGCGGRIGVQCNITRPPLGFLLPFYAWWGMPEKCGKNELVIVASGPLAGITANYAIMAAANGYHAAQKGSSKKEILQAAFTSPASPYKAISSEITRMITNTSNYQMLSFSEIFMIAFNLLKSSKMLGECIYGFTPMSFTFGDGQSLWQLLGLKKDLTISPLKGVCLATIPLMAAIAFGITKGIVARKNKQKISDANDHIQEIEQNKQFDQFSQELTTSDVLS